MGHLPPLDQLSDDEYFRRTGRRRLRPIEDGEHVGFNLAFYDNAPRRVLQPGESVRIGVRAMDGATSPGVTDATAADRDAAYDAMVTDLTEAWRRRKRVDHVEAETVAADDADTPEAAYAAMVADLVNARGR